MPRGRAPSGRITPLVAPVLLAGAFFVDLSSISRFRLQGLDALLQQAYLAALAVRHDPLIWPSRDALLTGMGASNRTRRPAMWCPDRPFPSTPPSTRRTRAGRSSSPTPSPTTGSGSWPWGTLVVSIRRLADHLVRFCTALEDPSVDLRWSGRRNDIETLQVQCLQRDIRMLLRRQARLAAMMPP